MIEPIVRIVLRYGAGATLGMEVGDMLAGDPDVVLVGAALVSLATEAWYAYARRKGKAT